MISCELNMSRLVPKNLSSEVKVEFRPKKRQDKLFAIEIFKDFKSVGFIHWIESSNGRICRVNNHELIMSPCQTEEQALGNCAWLNSAYREGRVS